MRSLKALLQIYALAAGCAAFANLAQVELDYRLQPDRDLTASIAADAITTMRVLEDRGIVASSNGRLSSRPTTIHMGSRQAIRYVTGKLQPGGGFPVEMTYLDKTTHVNTPDGRTQLLPEKTRLKGVRVTGAVDATGKLRADSVNVSGVEPNLAQSLREMMTAVLTQASDVEPMSLTFDKSVPQDLTMQIPVAGITTLDLKMRTMNRLLAIEGDVARVQQIYSMTFGTPSGAIKMKAEGSGGGTMLYQISTKTLLSSETGTLMKFVLDAPEGVIEIQLNSRESQKMLPTAPGAR